MRLHRKAHTWLKEFVGLFSGAIVMNIYTEPPEHYLGYTVAGKVPVILIPGVMSKWGYMKPLGDKISHLGHPVYIVPELGLNIYSIPTSAKTLRALIVRAIPRLENAEVQAERGARIVRKFIEEKNIRGAIIVAHSKGGLIGKYLLTHYNPDNRVLGMIALATPFAGSALAKLIPHDAYKELKKDSEIILDLEHHKAANAKIISVFPEYDTHVWAETGSYLEGAAENIEVPVGGHATLLSNRKIQEAILKSVDKITAWAH